MTASEETVKFKRMTTILPKYVYKVLLHKSHFIKSSLCFLPIEKGSGGRYDKKAGGLYP